MPSEQRQNISLGVQAGGILNIFNSSGENPACREALVEDLLWLTQRGPGGNQPWQQALVGDLTMRAA